MDDFEKYYKKYFDELVEKMKERGFSFDPETNKFSKSASMDLLLDEAKTEVIKGKETGILRT